MTDQRQRLPRAKRDKPDTGSYLAAIKRHSHNELRGLLSGHLPEYRPRQLFQIVHQRALTDPQSTGRDPLE